MSRPTDARLSLVGWLLRLRHKPAGYLAMRAIDVTRAKWCLRGHKLGRGVSTRGPIFLDVKGRLELGDRVRFCGNVLPTSLIVHPGAAILVGDESIFNYGASLEACSRITIGRRCMFGSLVRIGDRDGQRTAPIVIGDDVWLAHGVIIGPGVTIGDGSVVGAGSVVTKDVPPQSMALGNPARAMSLSLRTGAKDG